MEQLQLQHFVSCRLKHSTHQMPCSCCRYARVAKQSRMKWLRACEEVCLYRPSLLSVLLLVDSSIPAKTVDMEAAQWFAEHAVPFSIVFTKADKKKAGCPAPKDNIAAFRCGAARQLRHTLGWTGCCGCCGCMRGDCVYTGDAGEGLWVMLCCVVPDRALADRGGTLEPQLMIVLPQCFHALAVL
jgi:hypothetical protein